MKTILLAGFCFLFVLVEAGNSQNIPGTELYLGSTLMSRGPNTSQLFSVNGAADFNRNQWFGIRGDVGAHIGEVYAEKSLGTLLAGPVFSVRSVSGLRPFGHALIGGAVSGCADSSPCQTGFALAHAFGGGVDVQPWKRRIAVRVSADALTTRFHGQNQHFTRVSFGVAFPLGSRS